MTDCNKIADYLDRHLGESEQEEFFSHLERCATCREAFERWRDREDESAESIDVDGADPPTMREAALRVQRIKKGRAPNPAVSRPFLLGTATLAVLVLVGISYLSVDESPKGDETPGISEKVGANEVPGSEPFELDASYILEATGAQPRLEKLRDNLVVMAPGARVRVQKSTRKRTVLELLEGKIACNVARTADFKQFDVRAGQYLIRVTGTLFSVGLGNDDSLKLVLGEGSASVTDQTERTWQLTAGQQLNAKSGAPVFLIEATPAELNQLDLLLGSAPSM